MPAAGLPAVLWHRRRPSSPLVKAALGLGAFCVLIVGLFLGSVLLPALVAGAACLFVASRLARMQLGWILAGVFFSAICLVVDRLAAWFLWYMVLEQMW